jgi:hypothetical protein
LSNPHANPIVLDANGEANIFLESGAYRFDLKTPAGGLVWTFDPIQGQGVTLDSVDSIAELRTLSPGARMVANVLGYYAAGDEGGGTFYFDPASADAEDFGVTILPTSAPVLGRWKRILDKEVSVKYFGAKGDGVTDDYTAVGRAVNFAGAAGNDLYFSKGTYVIGTNLTVLAGTKIIMNADAMLSPKVGVTLTLRGTLQLDLNQHFTGLGTVVFARGAAAEYYPQWWGAVGDNSTDCAAAFNAAILSIYTSGGGQLRVPSGEYRLSANVRLRRRVDILGDSRAYFYPTTNNIKMFDTDGATINDDFKFRNIEIQNPLAKTGVIGVYAEQARHNVVFENLFIDSLDQGMVFTNLCWMTTARECYVYGCRIGFEVGNSSHNFVFDRCTAYDCTQYGFYAHAEVTDIEPVLFKTQFIACLSQGNDLYGFYLKTCGYPSIIGGYSEANSEADVYALSCQALHMDGHYGGSNFGKTHLRLRSCDGANLNNVCCPGVRTCQLTGTATIGSPTLTGMSDTSGFPVGLGALTISGFAGTRSVIARTSTTITLDGNSSVNGTATITTTTWTFDVDSSNVHVNGFLLRSASNNLLSGTITGMHLQENLNGSTRLGNIGHGTTKIYGVIDTSSSASRHWHSLTNNRFDKNDVQGSASPYTVDCRTAYDVQRKAVRGGEIINLTNPEDGQVMYFILRGASDMGTRAPSVKIGASGSEYDINMLGSGADLNTIVALEYDGDYGWIVLSDTGWNKFGSRPVDVEGLRHRSGSSVPVSGTWKKGDLQDNNAITTTNGIHGWRCTQSGTFGSFSSLANTTNGSPVLTSVPTLTNLKRGDFISVSGGFPAGTYPQVLSYDATFATITLDTAATSSVGGVTAAHSTPLFERYGRTLDKDFSVSYAQAAGTNEVICENTDGTATAHAKLHAKTTGDGGGNPSVHLEVPGFGSISLGIDNALANNPGVLAYAGILTSGQLMYLYPAANGGLLANVRLQTKEGANVASAGDLTLGTAGNFFTITGTTTINGIAIANWQSGAVIRLKFNGALTLTHNGAPSAGFGKLLLNGSANGSPTAGSVYTFLFDGTNWNETSKMVR